MDLKSSRQPMALLAREIDINDNGKHRWRGAAEIGNGCIRHWIFRHR
jgi:hypothetical protein